MSIKIALAGNPNCGKTTLFNALTGSGQFVGNWPGVTVEKKEGRLKGHKDVMIMDLPGIYSLSPYTLEEVVARDYLINERPDVILNIVDGTNIERNLYLTIQLTELGIPVIIAVNMTDLLEKQGDKIHIDQLSVKLGCEVVEISALKGRGIREAADKAVALAMEKKVSIPVHKFADSVESVIEAVEEQLGFDVLEEQKRFFAIKLLEKDDKIPARMKEVPDISSEIKALEDKFDDDTESIITNERYEYIASIIEACCIRSGKKKLSTSDKIDRVVTNRWLALPIFAVVMFLIYYISVTTVGTWMTDWTNDGLFGDGWQLLGTGSGGYEEDYGSSGENGIWVPGIPVLLEKGLDAVNCAEWLKGLVLDGIVAGVGAVLGFVPQMLVLFIFLAFLEACGYMARVAFIMDRIFRKFGLSGKSFIPMLVGTGCGVPGIMASRTIENDRDRKMTILTTTFIPCGAKLPIIALITATIFGGAWWVAPSAYFVGIASIVFSGMILKKTKMFAGSPAPFVMELPAYHMPAVGNVLRSMWERGWSFIKKAGTIILLSSILIWAGTCFGSTGSGFGFSTDMELSDSILGHIADGMKWIFAPLGFGEITATIATIMGLVAKEEVVGVFGILDFGGFTRLAGYSFLIFNLLCAPCFAAMGAIKREMNNKKWFWFAIGYQTIFAYIVSLCVYQIGMLLINGVFGIGTAAAVLLITGFLYLLLRPFKDNRTLKVNMKKTAGI